MTVVCSNLINEQIRLQTRACRLYARLIMHVKLSLFYTCIYVDGNIYHKFPLVIRNLGSHLNSFSVVLTHDLPPELWLMEVAQQAPLSLPTDSWLQQWLFPLQATSICTVPLTVNSVHTPICAPAWGTMLRSYPDKHLVQFVLEGISKGFRIGFVKSLLNSARSTLNTCSALEHPDVVTKYLHTEISLGHVAGPSLHVQSHTFT